MLVSSVHRKLVALNVGLCTFQAVCANPSLFLLQTKLHDDVFIQDLFLCSPNVCNCFCCTAFIVHISFVIMFS